MAKYSGTPLFPILRGTPNALVLHAHQVTTEGPDAIPDIHVDKRHLVH